MSDFPIDIIGYSLDGKDKELKEEVRLGPKPRDSYTEYIRFTVPLKKKKKIKNLFLQAVIPGSDRVFEIEVAEYPSYKKWKDEVEPKGEIGAIQSSDSILFFKERNIVLTDSLVVDTGQVLRFYAGQRIAIADQGKLIVKGSLEFFGTSDIPVSIDLSTSGSYPIELNGGSFLGTNVVCSGANQGGVYAENATINFQSAYFSDISSDLITARESTVTFTKCAGGQVANWGRFDRCTVRVKQISALNGDCFLRGAGSDVEMYDSRIFNYKLGVDLDYTANFNAWNVNFEKLDILTELNNASHFQAVGGILSAETGFNMDLNSLYPGNSSYFLQYTQEEFGKKENRVNT